MTYSKRKLKQLVKKIIIKDFNFNNNLSRRSKIDDLVFCDDLLFDFLNMFEFRCQLEEELGLQIEFDEDNHDYEKMTVNEFINVLYDLVKTSNTN